MKTITLTFDDDDNIVLKVTGVKGKICKEITRDVEEALGKVISTELTPEYKQTEVKNAAARVSTKR